MLRYEISNREAAREGGNVLVLLHGRGSDRHDLVGLHKRLAPDWPLVTPEAPFPAAPWGYGPGWAWYQFLGRNRPEPQTFSQSLDQLDSFLDALPDLLGAAPGHIALGGFSQGGTMSIAYALNHPGRVDVINFSGFLADHPRVQPAPENVQGTRFFWGHGTEDPNIPFALAIEGRALLSRASADLVTHDYSIGHWIDVQELANAQAWLERTGDRAIGRTGDRAPANP